MPINYERDLNPQQRAAVFHGSGPALVVAGAGTGKTRTLVYRVARLVEQGNDPRQILLLTFTRRSAREMLRRAAALLEDDRARRVSGGTFHSFAHMILRRFGTRIGIAPNFTVLDRSDSEDIINHLRTEMGFAGRSSKSKIQNPKRFPQKRTLGEILSKAANTRSDLREILQRDWPQFTEEEMRILAIRDRYAAYKRGHALLDYDDLLIELLRLLDAAPDLREKIAARFRHMLVDEYQDTNRLQAEILVAIAQHRSVMAVGDDAQAIYSFRGADFRNIMEFPKDFPGTAIYTIEENYRSTQPILEAANAVIAQAPQRYEKTLFTARIGGIPPKVVGCAGEAAQASYVADEILRLREEGVPFEDIAVLFRASYHSFELEAELVRRNIPFVKYGGFKFAEAAHVKDAMAHLRWLVNPNDLIAAQRCLLLVEGIGPVSARAIADIVASSPSVAEGLRAAEVPARAATEFRKLCEAMTAAQGVRTPAEQLAALDSYLAASIAARFDDAPRRLRDLAHLAGIARRYRATEHFVSHFSIEPPADDIIAGVSGVENEEEPLVLSTIHSAKGLEWKAVFILSVLDGYLPQDYAFRNTEELEEERRLLYVAMTRAKEELTMTYPMLIVPGSAARQGAGEALWATPVFAKPSQFLDGIPEDILPHVVLADSDMLETSFYDDDNSDAFA